MTHVHMMIETASSVASGALGQEEEIKPPHRLWLVWDMSAGLVLSVQETAARARMEAEQICKDQGGKIAVVFARLFYDPDKVIGDSEPRL